MVFLILWHFVFQMHVVLYSTATVCILSNPVPPLVLSDSGSFTIINAFSPLTCLGVAFSNGNILTSEKNENITSLL